MNTDWSTATLDAWEPPRITMYRCSPWISRRSGRFLAPLRA